MILKKIYLENFRGYSEIEIEFDNKKVLKRLQQCSIKTVA